MSADEQAYLQASLDERRQRQAVKTARQEREHERLSLLDAALFVMVPNGKLLAKNDDIRWGIVTDSLIEGLVLPVVF